LYSAKETDVKVTNMSDHALLALQGPLAEQALQKLVPSITNLSTLKFFQGAEVLIKDVKCWVQRTGYTGEDGFEVRSLPLSLSLSLFVFLNVGCFLAYTLKPVLI
jgi:aminomethyltransferase